MEKSYGIIQTLFVLDLLSYLNCEAQPAIIASMFGHIFLLVVFVLAFSGWWWWWNWNTCFYVKLILWFLKLLADYYVHEQQTEWLHIYKIRVQCGTKMKFIQKLILGYNCMRRYCVAC